MKKFCLVFCLLLLLFIMSCEIPDPESIDNPELPVGEITEGQIFLGPGLDNVPERSIFGEKCLGILPPKYFVVMQKSSTQESVHWDRSLTSFYGKNNDMRNQGWRMYGVEGQFFDCNGTVSIYSGFFKPSTVAQKDYFNYEYGSAWDIIEGLYPDGWRLFLVDGFTWDGKIRYNFSLRKYNNSDWQLFCWYYKDFQDLFDDIYWDGWKVNVFDTFYVNGKLSVNASFTKGISDYQAIVLGYPVSSFKSLYNSFKEQGWRISQLDVEGSYASAVFLLGPKDQKFIYDCSESELQSKLIDKWSQGYRTIIFDSSF